MQGILDRRNLENYLFFDVPLPPDLLPSRLGNCKCRNTGPYSQERKNAIRLISNAHFNAHTEPLFKKWEILKFEDLYKSTQIEFMQSLILEKLPPSFEGIWQFVGTNKRSALRNSADFYIPFFRLLFTERLPLHSLPRAYNNFTNVKLKQAISMNTFKDGIKSHFLNNYSDVIRCDRLFCKDCFPDQF